MDTIAKFRAYDGHVLTEEFFSFDAAMLTSVGQMPHAIIWEESFSDGCYDWTQWERDEDGEWWPMVGGHHPFTPIRPWEIE